MVDICRPPLVWVDGRCYRLNSEQEYSVTRGYTGEEETVLETEENGAFAEMEMRQDIEQLDNNRFRVVLPVASAFFPQIIGKGGQTKTRLETDTRTKINIPRKGLEGDIVITGGDRNGVASAASRIEVMVEAARNKQPFTHFLSIPLNLPQVQEAFNQFQKQVLDSETEGKSRGLDASIFQTSSMLHLTIGTMALLDQRERELARDVLLECKEELILPLLSTVSGLEIELQGLELMNDDPGEVDVLYIGVQDRAGILQEIVERMVDRFVGSGLMRREYSRVKLHCTLLNTLFRRDTGEPGDTSSSSHQGQDRESFDARPLIQGWGDLSLGLVQVKEIHLSQRRAGRRTAEGYYLPSAVVNF